MCYIIHNIHLASVGMFCPFRGYTNEYTLWRTGFYADDNALPFEKVVGDAEGL